MFKTAILLAVLLISVVVNAEISTLSDAVVKDLDGKDVSFEQFKGKCALVINTASGCGFTSTYRVRTLGLDASMFREGSLKNRIELTCSVLAAQSRT